VRGALRLVETIAEVVVDELARLVVELRVELRRDVGLVAQERAGLRRADDGEVDPRLALEAQDLVLDGVERDLPAVDRPFLALEVALAAEVG